MAVVFLEGISPNGPILSTSDWHVGDGGASDDFNEPGALWLLQRGMLYLPNLIVLNGDTFERWQSRLSKIIAAHREFFAKAEDILLSTRVRPVILPIAGNHDSNIEEVNAALRQLWPRLEILPPAFGDDAVEVLGWRFLHGHQFDTWNKKGPLRPVAHGLTYFAGLLERAFGGLDEGKLNPESWVSPAHDYTKSAHGDISDAIFKYTEEQNCKVCFGHTHNPDISRNRLIVNSGCCVGGRSSAALLWAGGDANLITLNVEKS